MSGTALSKVLQKELAQRCLALPKGKNPPGLAVIQVGADPASSIYVGHKIKACEKIGYFSKKIALGERVCEDELLAAINGLNQDPAIHGILVQLPLPKHFDEQLILESIVPQKDVDGFHPLNVGALHSGLPGFVPCTPRGIMTLLAREKIDLQGLSALVIGRSNIVGKPIAALLTKANATVTVAHSRSREIGQMVSQSDVVVAAVGRPGFVEPDWVKDHQVLVDVGINRIESQSLAADLFSQFPKRLDRFEERGFALVGDIHPGAFLNCQKYTPVPGGVGPLTIASLLENTFDAFMQQSSYQPS